MFQCDQCDGFLPPSLKTCPNCGAGTKSSLSKRFKRASQLVLGASVAMTLSACYGTPPPIPLPECKDQTETAKEPCVNPSPGASPSAGTSAGTQASPAPSPSASPSV